MNPAHAHEMAIAVATAARDADPEAARAVLRAYLDDGADPARIALAACRLLSIADARICRQADRAEGGWLQAAATSCGQ